MKSCLILAVFCLVVGCRSTESASDLVPKGKTFQQMSEATAIAIAEAIGIQTYGEGIKQQRPYKAKLDEGVWIVEGQLPEDEVGGTYSIKIDANTYCVIEVKHSK